jgi:hypothetical protein
MVKRVKKTLLIVGTVVFALSLPATALAAGPSGTEGDTRGQAVVASSQTPMGQAPGNQNQRGLQDAHFGGMDSKAIETAIAALSDDDADTLSEYIDDYEDALAAEQEAIEDGAEGADLSTYRDAVQSALQALLDAARDADIDLGLVPPAAGK